jgi:class 3 adenylate cyclase
LTEVGRLQAAHDRPSPVDKAERRQLTLLFCDLEDSVALSTRLDPEDLRDLIVAYQATCARAIERYDGYVARYLGDGILAYFGYPVAHEDNAERAIRAGLELVDAVARLKASQFPELNIRVRVGIATGLVVVGDANAQGVVDQGSVVGEAANLAARLQAIARADTVVVSDVTRQLAMEGFEYRDLGRQDLKGFAAPVTVYQVVGPRDVTRLEARGTLHTSFVGRHEEMAIFADRWKRACTAQGQLVVLAGPAGIGKSRIVAEAAERLRQLDGALPLPVILQCSPYHANTPLYPVVRHLLRRAAINSEDGPETRRLKIARLMAGSDPGRDTGSEAREPDAVHLALLAELVGVEPHESDRTTGDPVSKRNLLADALLPLLASASATTLPSALPSTLPTALIVFEDAQWIDPTSKLLLGRLGQWARTGRALVVATARGGRAFELLADIGLVEADGRYPDHVTVHEVRELDAADGRRLALAAASSEGFTIDDRRLDAVVARSGGLPLYLEQLVKAAAGGFDPSPEWPGDAVPTAIDDVLMAELDRRGPAKAVAQRAAVIGPEFAMGLLARIMQCSLDELVPLLLDLERSKILVRSAGAPDLYRFRHSLLHEIAYRSLLRKARQPIHLAVARELSRQSAESAQAGDELIARHYALGEQYAEAVDHWRRAAAKAIARSANEEAIAMLRSALDALGKEPGPRQPELELELVLAQALAMRSVRGYSDPEVEQTLLKAREMATACGDPATQFSVDFGLFQCTIVKGDTAAAQARARGLLELAGPEPSAARIDGYLAMGIAAVSVGEFVPSIEYHEMGAALCRPETDSPRFQTHGQNAGLFCLSYLARTQCIVGRLDQGRATMRRARQIAALRAQDPGHVHSLLNTAIFAVRISHLCGDLAAERRLAEETVELARRNHYAYYEALGLCHLGWVAGQQDGREEGIAALSAAIGTLRRTGTSLALPGFQVLLAQLCIRAGRLDEAAALIAAAAAVGEYAVWASEIERTRGDLIAADWAAAEAAYRASLAIARRQKAGLFVCKAADSLARLLQSRGRLQEAHDILHEGLAPLSEGEDVLPIRRARATLQGLAQSLRLGSRAG